MIALGTPALIILAITIYALFGYCTSQAGGRIDASLSSLVFNGLGALVPLVVYYTQRFVYHGQMVATRSSGIVYSVLAGLAIAAFSVILIKIYGRGESLSYVFPTVYGGAIALTAVIGWVTLKESVSILHVAGVGCVVVGIALLALPVR